MPTEEDGVSQTHGKVVLETEWLRTNARRSKKLDNERLRERLGAKLDTLKAEVLEK